MCGMEGKQVLLIGNRPLTSHRSDSFIFNTSNTWVQFKFRLTFYPEELIPMHKLETLFFLSLFGKINLNIFIKRKRYVRYVRNFTLLFKTAIIL